MATSIPDLDPTTERRLAAGLYNDCWRLLELPERTPEQNDELIHQAHASRYHWARVGERANLARGEWMCARVYAVLGRPEPALWHARRCLEMVESGQPGEDGFEDWDRAGAYECLARAYVAAGDRAEAARWLGLGREAIEVVRNPRDRVHIEEDLDSIQV